jgi:hypothetical protein
VNKKLTAASLDPQATAPHGLDNQYVPNYFLKQEKTLKDVREEVLQNVRSEYLRSLLYSPQIVLNRAYIINSPAIYRDFLAPGEERMTFLSLLNEESIIPWLYKETSLDQRPAFTLDETGWGAVKEIVKEAQIPYLRLDWDEEKNIQKTNKLSIQFTGYLKQLVMIHSELAEALKINPARQKDFRSKLIEVARYCDDVLLDTGNDFVTRDQMYLKFICAEGTKSADGLYDYSKGFVSELKQLFDLKYNVNLPDALGIESLTAYDLPDRSALKEIELALMTN